MLLYHKLLIEEHKKFWKVTGTWGLTSISPLTPITTWDHFHKGLWIYVDKDQCFSFNVISHTKKCESMLLELLS